MHMASVTGLGFVLLISDSETIVAYKTQSGSISLMYFSDAEGSLSLHISKTFSCYLSSKSPI